MKNAAGNPSGNADRSIAEITYRIPGRALNSRPGAHHSNSRGAGMNFAAHARLLDHPDPRRLDLRASISNIQKEWLVRINQQNAAISIAVIADVSATMHFGAGKSKLSVVADFVETLAYSTARLGDSVGLSAFDQNQRPDLSMPPRFGRGTGQSMAAMIRSSEPSTDGAANINALAQCINTLVGKPALIFIVSDFHFPLNTLVKILDPLAGLYVVPVVVWDSAEVNPPQKKRLLSIRQMGGNARRNLWLTPSVRAEWHDNVVQRQQQITDVFSSRDERPFFVTDRFDAEELSRYFMEAPL